MISYQDGCIRVERLVQLMNYRGLLTAAGLSTEGDGAIYYIHEMLEELLEDFRSGIFATEPSSVVDTTEQVSQLIDKVLGLTTRWVTLIMGPLDRSYQVCPKDGDVGYTPNLAEAAEFEKEEEANQASHDHCDPGVVVMRDTAVGT